MGMVSMLAHQPGRVKPRSLYTWDDLREVEDAKAYTPQI